MPFIRIPLTSDAQTLADAAITRLAGQWLDWEPSDGDMEVIQIEAIAPMAQNAAEVASIVPDAIFRGYGTNLIGLSYSSGTPAVGTVTVTAPDTAGYTAEGPIEFYLNGIAFLTDEDVIIPATFASEEFACTALVLGTEGNGLSGLADPANAITWLETLEVEDPTEGGTDPETDEEYQDRLSERLQLQATTLVTGRDFELMALEQVGIGRALAIVGTAREVTVCVTDDGTFDDPGEPCTTDVKDDLEALYEDYRQVNTVYTIIDATYTTIDVTFTLVALPDDPDGLVSRAEDAVEAWLHPFNWGHPPDQPPSKVWLQETVVRYSELLRVLSVLGTRYVKLATLEGGTIDVNLSGTVPLTRPGTVVGLWAVS